MEATDMNYAYIPVTKVYNLSILSEEVTYFKFFTGYR